MKGRVMAVDPGSKNLGIALSDPGAILARPLVTLRHIRMEIDCQTIVQLADENEVMLIIIGQALGEDGESTPQARHARRIAEKLCEMTSIKVEMWDESHSTNQARLIQIKNGRKRSKRTGHLDADAAAVILQSYLDSNLGMW